MSASEPSDTSAGRRSREWNWKPEKPIATSPLFDWPSRPLSILRWFFGSWLLLTERIIVFAISLATWFYLQPPLEDCSDFAVGWIAFIYLRNLALFICIAGVLHFYFYTFKVQGTERKFDPRDMAKNHRAFSFKNQVHDNMFWSLASGVTVWTGFEVLMMWGFANGFVPYLAFEDNPVWFVLIFLIMPIWGSFHFYWIHRLLHWPPLYRTVHQLHHRNINIGPWSGMSMHPVEHLLYLSTVLIHWVILSHPLHVIFHLQHKAFEAASSHTGYEVLLVKDRDRLRLGDFFHQLHHRYFECNYGTLEMPWDRWFNSFHDGSADANEAVRERRRRMHG